MTETMKKYLKTWARWMLVVAIIAGGGAVADVVVTAGTGTTIFAFTCFSTKVCPPAVLVDSTGTEKATAANPATIVSLASPTANFTRPADTTAYTIGDLIGNSTTAGSVVPLSWTVNRASTNPVYIERAILKKSTTGVTAPNFRLHLYTASPTIASGDNAAYSTTQSGHFCDIDINMPTTDLFSDANDGIGAPNAGVRCIVVPTAQTIYGLLEARGAYAPGNAEVFTAIIEITQP